jgi:WD40 repeat protein
VASAALDGTVRLWDAASGACLQVLTGHTGEIRGVALSADGQRVASGGVDATVRVWDTTNGECLHVLTGHTATVWGVALSGNGGLVASAALDGTVRLWDARGGAPLRTLRPDRLYERMEITGLTGVTAAQHDALLALGAVDRSDRATGA